jgi:hypothetical protein
MAELRRPVPVNWGKSFPPTRGNVEFIRVALEPNLNRDFTIYVGDVSQMEGIWSDRPYEITFANGGTSSVQNVYASVRGSAYHVAASEVVVRSDVTPGEDVPARAAFRFQAHCALGTPREHNVAGYQSPGASAPGAPGSGSINAPGVILFKLAAFSTHAWFDGLSGDLSNAEVSQIFRSFGVDTTLTTSPAADYAEPRVLDLSCNYLRLDVALAPATPIQWVFSQRILR